MINPGSVPRPKNTLGPHPPGPHQGERRQRSSSVDVTRLGWGRTIVFSPSATQVSSGHQSRATPLSSSSTIDDSGELPWLKASAQLLRPPPLSKSEDQAIQDFFAKYTLLPYDFPPTSIGKHNLESSHYTRAQRASQGFLEFLPCTFEEVNVRGRYALRWAVQAAALADAGSHIVPSDGAASAAQAGLATGHRALECYGKALSALAESLGKQGKIPDDYDLMTVVILDLFEVSQSWLHDARALEEPARTYPSPTTLRHLIDRFLDPFPTECCFSRLTCCRNVPTSS